MIGAIRTVKERVSARGGYLGVVANICGTEGELQGLPGRSSICGSRRHRHAERRTSRRFAAALIKDLCRGG